VPQGEDLGDNGQRTSPELGTEGDLHSPPQRAVPHRPPVDRGPKHLFKAQRLRAQLDCRRLAVGYPDLVLNRVQGTVRENLDHVCSARKRQPLAPEREASDHPTTAFLAFRVDASVPSGAADRVFVVDPDTVHEDERALLRAVAVVLKRRNRDWFHSSHRWRSEAYPHVRSFFPRRRYGTVLYTACTALPAPGTR